MEGRASIEVKLIGDEGTTGNFEFMFNGELLFSKIAEGRFPDEGDYAAIIEKVAPQKKKEENDEKFRISEKSITAATKESAEAKKALGGLTELQRSQLTSRGFMRPEGLVRWMALNGIDDCQAQKDLLEHCSGVSA